MKKDLNSDKFRNRIMKFMLENGLRDPDTKKRYDFIKTTPEQLTDSGNIGIGL